MKIVLISMFFLLTPLAFSEPDKADDIKKELSEVFVKEIKLSDIYDASEFGGFVRAKDTRAVGAEIDGTVGHLAVALGQQVKKGQKLFSLRPRGAGLNFQTNWVRSPISGMISKRIKNPGELVAAGEGVIEVADTTQLEVQVQVAYDDLSEIKMQQRLSISLNGKKSAKANIEGVVTSISPAADSELGTFPVILSLDCSSFEAAPCLDVYKLGTFVRAKLKRNYHRGIQVEAKYLISQRRKALLVDKDNKVKTVGVKLGAYSGALVEVMSGLTVGDRMVTNYSKFPKDGEKVVLKSKDEEKNKIYSKSKKKPKKQDRS